MKRIITVDGNEACSRTSYMFSEMAFIYPITPATPMAEHVDEWSGKNVTNLFGDTVKVVEMQSEAGAAGALHGALLSGCLASTYTASQGLLLMIPNMYKMAGEMLPCVMHVAARSLSTHALSIFGDHQDIYAARGTGFCMLASSSVQDTAYLSAIAHLSAIKASLPFLHFFDGFRTSHEIDKIEVLEKEDYIELLDKEAIIKFRNRFLSPRNPKIKGTASTDDIYFQATEARNLYYDRVPVIVEEYMEKLNEKASTNYHIFEYYGSKSANCVIVAMGSVCETIKETIDALEKEGRYYGLIEVHLYRPFSIEYLRNILPKSVTKVAVLDRTKEAGSSGEPLYLDVVNALSNMDIKVVGGRYGLSSKNTPPACIKAVYDMLETELKNSFTIGIKDDITCLSLPTDPTFKVSQSNEILIFGYGSDGMVSASKGLIKMIGENTPYYVQGYFEYDSKKSGGVTAGHLRYSKSPIRSTYYVENPSIVVVTKETYLDDFECLKYIKENGIFILNTSSTKEEISKIISIADKKILKERNITCYMMNAYELASKVGLGNKISTIMESILVKVSGVISYREAKEKMKLYAKERFFKKGEEIYQANCRAIEEAEQYLIPVTFDNFEEGSTIHKPTSIFEAMTKRLGNELPTSAFLDYADGTYLCGTAALEKRAISEIVPHYLYANCIQCNQCSLVCPHGVIRPFLLTEEEYNQAPIVVKKQCIKATLYEGMYFTLGISIKDCTGCGVCIETCPGKNQLKALTFKTLDAELKEEKQEIFDYLIHHISNKIKDAKSIRDSQFEMPAFAFSGACAGCGETAYIKLLTQLFKNQLVIVNATGCSSIYGASMPSMPYTVPWGNSLFEDNAEYGYGLLLGNQAIRHRIKRIMEENLDNPNQEYFKEYIENMNDYDKTYEVYQKLDDNTIPISLKWLKDYIPAHSTWAIGGDGWAYDIGFGGIDHVLSSNDNINILVLDSQVYSNTGGQSSKSSHKGSIASFTAMGKKTSKKDLARIALNYPNAYVASVNLGYNATQVMKAFKEAAAHDGPSIVIAYAPCIAHGIKGGMSQSVRSEKLATECGYYPTFRYSPENKKFTLDCKQVDFSKYDDFLKSQTRYSMLEKINPESCKKLLEENKKEAMERYQYYQELSTKY